MKILWVNHASFVIESRGAPHYPTSGDGVRLICDPWIDGTAFNNGWRHISPTKFTYQDFANITHIWFSHEHPDHFSPPNLQKIPEEHRRRITVLFHFTKDKRVIEVCKSLGFQTQELPEDQWVFFGEMRVICGRNGQIDSWLGIESEGQKLLNMNDCVYERTSEIAHIREIFGQPDVLFTQFSYANWVGNHGDSESQKQAAQDKRNEMRKQAQIFQPRQIVPFASFVWFSHQENFYMNEGVNRISDISKFCSDDLHIPAVVLYPGDIWEAGTAHDSSAALQEYESEMNTILKDPHLDKSAPVSDEKLQELASAFSAKLQKQNNRMLLALMPAATVYLTDKDQTALVSCTSLQLAGGRQGKIDIEMSSDSLAYCMRFGWGGDTLQVNGRYQVPADGSARKFFRIFRVAGLNTANEHLDTLFVAKKIASLTFKPVEENPKTYSA
jgi:UDP-MurNAc hydroxylase